MPEPPSDLQQFYLRLNLSPDAGLEELDKAYFQLKAEKISQKLRQEIPALKEAYQTIKEHLQNQLAAQSETAAPPSQGLEHRSRPTPSSGASLADTIQAAFAGQGFNIRVHFAGPQIHLQLFAAQKQGPRARKACLQDKSKTIAKIHTWLKNNAGRLSELHEIKTVQISAYRSSSRQLWSQVIPMPGAQSTFEDHDVTSFQSHLVQMFGFPGLLLVALLLNALPPIKFLLRGVTIWFHEFGHATVAWLAGRKAIPLPLGWTNFEPTKSLFVYVSILILFGLMGWAGYREKRWWPVVLAIALSILQFFMTWVMPTDTFYMLFSFGGVGGEFYLCALLMVSFFFPLPNYFRWELYRYPVVIGAGFTFWGSFSLWQQIDRGRQSIPWGSLWGGPSHEGGDMNQLSLVYNWSDQKIIDTYNTIGGICLSLIIGVYLYFLWKNQRSHLMLFWHQCMATYWK